MNKKETRMILESEQAPVPEVAPKPIKNSRLPRHDREPFTLITDETGTSGWLLNPVPSTLVETRGPANKENCGDECLGDPECLGFNLVYPCAAKSRIYCESQCFLFNQGRSPEGEPVVHFSDVGKSELFVRNGFPLKVMRESDPDVLRAELSFLSTPASEDFSDRAYDAILDVREKCAVDFQALCAADGPTDDLQDGSVDDGFNGSVVILASLDNFFSNLVSMGARRLTQTFSSSHTRAASPKKMIKSLRKPRVLNEVEANDEDKKRKDHEDSEDKKRKDHEDSEDKKRKDHEDSEDKKRKDHEDSEDKKRKDHEDHEDDSDDEDDRKGKDNWRPPRHSARAPPPARAPLGLGFGSKGDKCLASFIPAAPLELRRGHDDHHHHDHHDHHDHHSRRLLRFLQEAPSATDSATASATPIASASAASASVSPECSQAVWTLRDLQAEYSQQSQPADDFPHHGGAGLFLFALLVFALALIARRMYMHRHIKFRRQQLNAVLRAVREDEKLKSAVESATGSPLPNEWKEKECGKGKCCKFVKIGGLLFCATLMGLLFFSLFHRHEDGGDNGGDSGSDGEEGPGVVPLFFLASFLFLACMGLSKLFKWLFSSTSAASASTSDPNAPRYSDGVPPINFRESASGAAGYVYNSFVGSVANLRNTTNATQGYVLLSHSHSPSHSHSDGMEMQERPSSVLLAPSVVNSASAPVVFTSAPVSAHPVCRVDLI